MWSRKAHPRRQRSAVKQSQRSREGTRTRLWGTQDTRVSGSSRDTRGRGETRTRHSRPTPDDSQNGSQGRPARDGVALLSSLHLLAIKQQKQTGFRVADRAESPHNVGRDDVTRLRRPPARKDAPSPSCSPKYTPSSSTPALACVLIHARRDSPTGPWGVVPEGAPAAATIGGEAITKIARRNTDTALGNTRYAGFGVIARHAGAR